MAGVQSGRVAEIAGRNLPGKDLTKILQNAGSANTNAIREAALFTYSGLFAVDSDFFAEVGRLTATGKDLTTSFKSAGQPNLMKRGSVRTAVDGRYKLTRYFSPMQRNRPQTLDQLYAGNDVELFDLQNDPTEMTNLAAVKGENRGLVATMSAKLEAVIKDEIGAEDGREMPDLKGVAWVLNSKGGETILD
jgi:arylsulfatase